MGCERVLVFGGSGQLGSDIVRCWTGMQVGAPSSAEANVEDAAAVERAFDTYAPDIVVNCTAFHNVDRCESEPERAFAVNALAVEAMAQLCKRRDAVFVTFSTDYVFDGERKHPYAESDVPRPINAYGVSKLAGELLVARTNGKTFVVRTCGVFGTRVSSSKGYTFIDRIVTQARSGEPVRVVSDMVITPSYTAHIAAALRDLLATQRYGLYHIANEGPVSWYDFAREALRQAGIACAVEPISYTSWNSAVRRPAYSALENARLHALGIYMPSWQEGISAYLRDKLATP